MLWPVDPLAENGSLRMRENNIVNGDSGQASGSDDQETMVDNTHVDGNRKADGQAVLDAIRPAESTMNEIGIAKPSVQKVSMNDPAATPLEVLSQFQQYATNEYAFSAFYNALATYNDTV